VILDKSADEDDIDALIEYFGSFFGDGKRLLRAEEWGDVEKPSMEIKGSISYINSHGYLNAD